MTAREILDDLPDNVADACAELFATHPIEQAMSAAVVREGKTGLYPLVEKAVERDAFKDNPYLVAGIWLYIDDLHRSHVVSQDLNDATGSYWHAIMHRREGDFWNSKYWLRQMRHHEACDGIDGYSPVRLVDMAADGNPGVPELQRMEWATLFVWCASHLP